jgi:hypothetical protein
MSKDSYRTNHNSEIYSLAWYRWTGPLARLWTQHELSSSLGRAGFPGANVLHGTQAKLDHPRLAGMRCMRNALLDRAKEGRKNRDTTAHGRGHPTRAGVQHRVFQSVTCIGDCIPLINASFIGLLAQHGKANEPIVHLQKHCGSLGWGRSTL